MIGPFETRVCDWCQQPVGECECDGGADVELECPCGRGCWDDNFDDWRCSRVERPVRTIDTGGLT